MTKRPTDTRGGTFQRAITELSIAFCEHLTAELTPDELREAIKRNHAETNPHACHTHDFCDSNITMNNAFISLWDEDIQPDDGFLVSSAWDEAKDFNFNFDERS